MVTRLMLAVFAGLVRSAFGPSTEVYLEVRGRQIRTKGSPSSLLKTSSSVEASRAQLPTHWQPCAS